MKVQNEMSTRISVDSVAAIGSLSAFRNAISATSNAWRAQETALKNSGNYSEAVKQRISGLNQVMELQKAKIRELRQEQDGLNLSNRKQGNQYLKLEKQISQANKQLASYESQAKRARSAAMYQISGLAGLQHAYRQSQEASIAYVNRLNAEHKSATATVEKYRQLKSSLANLESQYRKQDFLLKQVANDSGKSSSAYLKQKEQLDKTATSIAKTKDEMRSMQSSINRLQPTGIQRIDDAVVKTRDNASRMTSRLSAGFDNLKNHMFSIATTATMVGATMVSSINKAASLQKTMVENQNLMSTAGEKAAATQKEVNQMYSDGAKYSVQYGVSQKTIAEGYQELIKRGYDGRQSLGAMKSILEASRASGDDFNDTMKVTTSTLEAFGMRSETTAGMMRNTAKAADILAKGADVTSTSFKSIGEAMTYAGSSAKASGVSLRETTAVLGVLSNNGLEATQAGTGLQRILTRLAAPTSTATAAMKKYNLSIDDFRNKSGKLKNVNEIFQTINKNVPKADRLEFFNKVFGQTAQNAASILSRTASLSDKNSQSLAHVENQLKTAYSEDYVGKLARRNMNSAKNSEDRFKYASQAIQIEIGRNMLPALQKASVSMANAFGRKDTQRGLQVIANGLGKVAMGLTDVVAFIGKHTTTVKVFGTVMLTAFAGVKLLNGIGRLRTMMPLLSSDIQSVGTAAKIATSFFNPWVLAIAGVSLVLVELYKHSKLFRSFVNNLGSQTKKLAKHFVVMGRSILNNAGKLHNSLTRGWNNYWRSVQRGWNNYWRQQNLQQQQNQRTQERQEQASQRRRQRAIANFNRTVSRDAQNAWRGMERAAQNGSNRVSRWYDQLNRATSRSIQNMARNHPRTFNDMYKTIQDRTRTWHDVMTFHWDRLSSDTTQTARDMNKLHQRLFSDMYDRLNDLTDGCLGDMVKTWQDKMSSIGDVVSNAKSAIHRGFVDLVRGIISPFNQMLKGLEDGINWILDKVGANKIGGTWSVPMPSYASGTPGAHPGGLAKVNDGTSTHYREMYRLPNGEVGMFPAKRNMIVPLPKGTAILDGERSYNYARLMGMIPRYSDGVGQFFKDIKDGATDLMDDIDQILKNPVEFAKEVFQKFVKVSTPVWMAQQLVTHVPEFIAKQMGEWIKKQFASLANPGGAGVARWRPYIIAAFKQLGVEPAEWKVQKLLRQIATESGGNPLAWQGIHDVNSGGNEARGLLQFAGSTWAADALPGHTDWSNGFNEILAAIAVLERGGEGGWGNVGNGHGWANGGLVNSHRLIEIAEGNMPEYIIPTDVRKRGRAYQLLGEVMAKFHAEDPSRMSNQAYNAESNEIESLNHKLDAVISLLQSILGVGNSQIDAIKAQGSFDKNKFYKQQARDLAMKQFGIN